MSKEEIIEAVKAMTVVELSELVKAIEEEFGVSAVAQLHQQQEQQELQLKKNHLSM